MTKASLFWIAVIIAIAAGIAFFDGCAIYRTEADVLRVWGKPYVIPDSGWHIDHYVSADKTTNDFGINEKDSTVFFHNCF